MTVNIHITDTTNKSLVQEGADNPLELINEKIKQGELIVESFESEYNALTGICETSMHLKDKTPKLNSAYYIHKSAMIVQRMEKKQTTNKKECCHCEYHDYDTLFGGDDEYEICEKGHDLEPDECPDFKEL